MIPVLIWFRKTSTWEDYEDREQRETVITREERKGNSREQIGRGRVRGGSRMETEEKRGKWLEKGWDEDRRIVLSALILSFPKVPDISLHHKLVLPPKQAENWGRLQHQINKIQETQMEGLWQNEMERWIENMQDTTERVDKMMRL